MYSFAIAIYALIVRIISPFHRKARLMIKGQKQTFNILQEKIDKDSKYIWFHAASLGEFEQGRPMIETIKKERPDFKILLTFFSPSGYEIRKNYDQADVICYLPFDLPKKVRKFIQMVNPEMAIFIKYEFWMNYLNQLKKQNIPTFIISAIFRPDQIFFRPYSNGYKEVLNTFDRFFVQDEASKELLAKHGKMNVSVCGDTRIDRVYQIYSESKQLPIPEAFTKQDPAAPVLIAGSSWPKDEELIIPYFNQHPEIKLIIAPHEIHKEHIKSIISQLKRPYILYSEANEENIKNADCLIIDCIGLLSSIYRYGTIAYIGGGFGTGIHNILEAAVFGIPVIFGPNFKKFREAHEMIKTGGGVSIKDKDSFNETMDKLLSSGEYLKASGEKAGEYVLKNVGSTKKILKIIVDEVEKKEISQ